MHRRATFGCLISLLSLLFQVNCAATPGVSPNPSDTSPPVVRIGSINLNPELNVDSSRTPRLWSASPVATDAGEFTISTTATDHDSGIASVALEGRLRAWCGPHAQAVTGLTEHSDGPVTTVTPALRSDGTRTGSATAMLTITLARIRAMCLPGTTLVDWQADVTASARNGSGLSAERRSVAAINGQSSLRVIVFNMSGPCLSELENVLGDERNFRRVCLQQNLGPFDPLPGPHLREPMNTVLDRWGEFFSQQDLIFLSEAIEQRWLDRMLAQMPGFHHSQHGSVAILSRWPLSDIGRDAVTTSYSHPSVGSFPVTSEYLRATVASPGRPLVAYAVHWAHRPGPPDSSDNRVSLASRMSSDMYRLHPRTPVLVGGDFNSKSRFLASGDINFDDTSEENRGAIEEFNRYVSLYGSLSMPEMLQMETRLRNARAEVAALNDPSRYEHYYGWPVDYLFHRGTYVGREYTNFLGHVATPSDHPMLRFVLERAAESAP